MDCFLRRSIFFMEEDKKVVSYLTFFVLSLTSFARFTLGFIRPYVSIDGFFITQGKGLYV